MILVRAEMDRMGNVTARPVSDRWAKRFCRRAAENGAADMSIWAKDSYAAFFQEGTGAADFLEDCTPAQRRDLEAGWPIRFKADPWIVGHWYGYDAHTVAEGR